jgi:oligopeptide transport system ATP-binding protein
VGDVVLQARAVTKHYQVGPRLLGTRRTVHAVESVDLTVHRHQTLGVVGESGSGKSTLASILVGDERPTAGEVELLGRPLHRMSGRELRRARRDVQLVRQDPYTSLDPRMTVERIVREPFEIHPDLAPRRERRARVRELLALVGLNPDHLDRYPHQFSGGQRQRLGIARALAVRPQVLVCDEPVSALDVSVQAQVINLLEELQRELGIGIVFIAHDLSVVHHIAHRIAVMYLGRVVEEGEPDEIHDRPQHPYTKALIAAVPSLDHLTRGEHAQPLVLKGEIPSPLDPPSGCHFRTRCWQAQGLCAEVAPPLEPHGVSGHLAACHVPLRPVALEEPAGQGNQ